jgi:hypothetical protein
VKVVRRTRGPAYANLKGRKPREVWRGGALDAMGISVQTVCCRSPLNACLGSDRAGDEPSGWIAIGRSCIAQWRSSDKRASRGGARPSLIIARREPAKQKGRTVNKRSKLTPPSLGRSMAWLADRRRDPMPINTTFRPLWPLGPDPSGVRAALKPTEVRDGSNATLTGCRPLLAYRCQRTSADRPGTSVQPFLVATRIGLFSGKKASRG